MHDTSQAVACLTSTFLEILRDGLPSMGDFEDEAIGIGHGVIADAMGLALERFDEEVCSALPQGTHVHERRRRTLATEVGDVAFCRRVCRDAHGNPAVPLDETLDLCRGVRVSPGALSFLIDAGAEVSYARAAALLSRKGGSSVSPRTVMRVFRKVAAYLRNNADYIVEGGPSLGTMEAEQEHLYKSRLASVPCAWSVRGASDMARIWSRRYSGRTIPMPGRMSSLCPERDARRRKRIEDSLNGGPILHEESSGRGYEPPHQASLSGMRADIRYEGGLYAKRRVIDPQ